MFNLYSLARVLPLVRAHGKPVVAVNIIDCDANPRLPYGGFSVYSHTKGGRFILGPAKIKLYLSKTQKRGKVIKGKKLIEEVANKSLPNANVLDYFLSYPHLIPEELKGKRVFFFGTVYRDPSDYGHQCVRCLNWIGMRCCSGHRRLKDNWSDSDFVAVLAG